MKFLDNVAAIELEFMAGTTITEAAEAAVAAIENLNLYRVKFDFNGILLKVTSKSSVSGIVEEYRIECRKNRNKERIKERQPYREDEKPKGIFEKIITMDIF